MERSLKIAELRNFVKFQDDSARTSPSAELPALWQEKQRTQDTIDKLEKDTITRAS
jgi:hypothetical protein